MSTLLLPAMPSLNAVRSLSSWRADFQEAGLVTATDNRGWSALSYATASGRTAIVDAVVSLVERAVSPEEVRACAEFYT